MSEGATLALDGRVLPTCSTMGFLSGRPCSTALRQPSRLGREEILSGLVASVCPVRDLDEAFRIMDAHPNANATSILTASGRAAREFAYRASASMVGVNIGVAAPMAYFPFGGARDSFFGDLKVHGRDAFAFYTDQKVTIRVGSGRSRRACSPLITSRRAEARRLRISGFQTRGIR